MMKKVYRLKDLDCANCAAKMENAVAKWDGGEKVTISFMAQKMTLEAPAEQFDQIVAAAVKVCKKIEPDCEILI